MPYPPPEAISDPEFAHVLSRVKILLANLPADLPGSRDDKSIYALFLNFHLDDDYLERTGCEVATLGEQLEHIFGWKAQFESYIFYKQTFVYSV